MKTRSLLLLIWASWLDRTGGAEAGPGQRGAQRPAFFLTLACVDGRSRLTRIQASNGEGRRAAGLQGQWEREACISLCSSGKDGLLCALGMLLESSTSVLVIMPGSCRFELPGLFWNRTSGCFQNSPEFRFLARLSQCRLHSRSGVGIPDQHAQHHVPMSGEGVAMFASCAQVHLYQVWGKGTKLFATNRTVFFVQDF